ncbi:MAG: hypothetical protein IPI96_15190 [Saprospiraceae bacterium]|nr:hypothetical protein [Saprospiraceae bacterium]
MSKELQDLEIELGLLRNRVIEVTAAMEILKLAIIAERSKSTGIDRNTVKQTIEDEINSLVAKIQGTQD